MFIKYPELEASFLYGGYQYNALKNKFLQAQPSNVTDIIVAGRSIECFEPHRTLLIDDNPEVLRSARDYGIAHLLAVLQPDTRGPLREPQGFPAILSFSDIMPS